MMVAPLIARGVAALAARSAAKNAAKKSAQKSAKPEDKMAVEVEISEDDSEEDKPEDEAMSAKLAAEVAELKALVANFGAKPLTPAVALEVKTEAKVPTNFSEALEVVKTEGLSGSAATKAVIARFPDLYLAARNTGIRTL
jgi:hypothetical protein